MSGLCGISHVGVVSANLDSFRSFYEDIIGLETTIVFGGGPGHGRQAVLIAGGVMLQVFEIAGYDPTAHGFSEVMFERGRLDHLGFTVADLAALTVIRDRLLAVHASSGEIRPLGPLLSVRFLDPDGLEGEINCYNPDFDPSTLRAEDDIVDPDWLERTKRVLGAVPGPLHQPPCISPPGDAEPANTIKSTDR
jgi:catechol 2,3-dioxygenase-like lactoylglutathione lyase family enzyme